MAFWDDDMFSHCDKSAGKMKDKTKEKVNNIGGYNIYYSQAAWKTGREREG